MKRLAWITAVSLATILVLLIIWELRGALVLFILSLTIAATLRPIVDRWTGIKLPHGLALFFTYLIILTILLVLILVLSGPFISELQALSHDLPSSYAFLRSQWQASGNLLEQSIANNLPDLNNLSQALMGGQWNVIVQNSLDVTLVSLDVLSKIVLTFVVSIYWLADQEHFKRLWLSLLPIESRTRSRDIWQNIEQEIGAYLRSEIFQSLVLVILLVLGYQIIGLKYPVTLAIIGAAGWLIAWFGGIIAVIPALSVGLSISPLVGFEATAYTIAILAFLEFFVEPRLFKRHNFSSLLVTILVLITLKEFGLIAFFVAPPLAAAIQIVARQMIQPKMTTTANEVPPPPVVQIELLKDRLSSVKKTIAEAPDPASPEIINLVQRLEGLIDQANQEEDLIE